MNLSPAAKRSAARRRLLGLCLVLCAFAAAADWPGRIAAAETDTRPAAPARNVTLPLKVCGAPGAHLPAQPLLFNAPGNRDVINKKSEDGCYSSDSITLRTGQPYLIVVASEDTNGLSRFTVTPEDDKKLKPITVQLWKQGGAGSAEIEVCAKDGRGDSLPITSVEPAGGQVQLTRKAPAAPGCYRVSSAASGEYRLSLVAQGPQSNTITPLSSGEFRLAGLLLLLVTLSSLALGAYLLKRVYDLAPSVARQATVEEIARTVKGLSSNVPFRQATPASQKVTAPRQPDPQDAADAAPDKDSHGARGANVTPESEQTVPYMSKPAAVPRAKAHASARPRTSDFDDAKARYKALSGGQPVEHFYLMPSGASSASGTVENPRIELFEESTGTYVGFRSGTNKSEAFVFPMPNGYFSPDTFKALFPALSMQDYESANVDPRLAVNAGDKVWKIQ